MTSAFPQIVLDRTLRDLYSLDEPASPEIVLVNAVPTAKVQMTRSLPLSKKFAYQAPFAETEGADTLARIFLHVVPQCFGFVAGDMPLVIFDIDEDAIASTLQKAYRTDAFQTFAQLVPSQRPRISYVEKPEEIIIDSGAKIAVSCPMDCLGRIPHTVDPETHYALSSKRELWFSGLPTPESRVVETKLQLSQLDDKEAVQTEVSRLMQIIAEQKPPFVMKMPQAVAGFGTFVVRTREDHQKVLELLAPEIKIVLQQMNASNLHLTPGCFILQNMIPGESHSIALFITRSGKPIVTGCCKQVIGPTGRFGGAFIAYEEQESLERQYAALVEKLGKYVHGKGFYGPMGVDVMTNPEGEQLLIDMNIRCTGSHALGFLKNHFAQRKLSEAVVFFPLLLKCSMEEFHRVFQKEFAAGSLIIIGWCHDKEGKTSLTSIILAAEDLKSLENFIERVNVYRMEP